MQADKVEIKQFTHLCDIPLRWGDADRLGHINNVQFFRYAEEARVTWFARLFPPDERRWDKQGPILADMQCRFISQLHWPARLRVGIRAQRLGNSSITQVYGFFAGEEGLLVASGRSVVVWFDYTAQQPLRLSDEQRQRVIDFERVAPGT